MACYEQGKWQQAVSWLKAQVQNEPQDEAAWFYLGNAYYKFHDDVNALQMYQKALECQKSLAEAKVNMASVWQRLQEQDSLEKHFRKLLWAHRVKVAQLRF